MPRGDGTGPRGYGPMTGRGMGYCAGYDVPGSVGPGGFRGRGRGYGRGFGRGYGWGPGYGRGRGYGFGRGLGFGAGSWQSFRDVAPPWHAAYGVGYQPQQAAVSAEDLMDEADYLREEVDLIQKRINEIDKAVKDLKSGGEKEDK